MAIKMLRTIVFWGCLICLQYTSTAMPISRAVIISQPVNFVDSVKNNSDILIRKATTISIIIPRTGKRGLQPWLFATEADTNISPINELISVNDTVELNPEMVQLHEEVFSDSAKNSTNVTLPVIEAIINGSNFSNSLRRKNEVRRAELITVAETAISENISETTIDAVKEAVNTVKITTKSTENEIDPFTESIMLDAKTTIEVPATNTPQTLDMNRFTESTINESEWDFATKHVEHVKSNLAHAANLTSDPGTNYMNLANNENAIADVPLLQYNSNYTAETITPGYVNFENKTIVDPQVVTADFQDFSPLTSIEYINNATTSIMMKQQFSNAIFTYINSSTEEENTAADFPTTFPIAEENVAHNASSYSNGTELTTLFYEDTQMTVTENKKDISNFEPSSISFKLGKNHENMTVTNGDSSELDSFKFEQKGTQMTQDAENETIGATIQDEQFETIKNERLGENATGVNSYVTKIPKDQSSINYSSEMNVMQLSSNSHDSISDEMELVTTPKLEVTVNSFEYTIMDAPTSNPINENVNQSATFNNSAITEYMENYLNKVFSETDKTTQEDSVTINMNFTTITTQKTLQNTSIEDAANDTTLMLIKFVNSTQNVSSLAKYAVDKIETISANNTTEPSNLENKEKYITLYKTDELFISDTTNFQLATVTEENFVFLQEMTENVATIRTEENIPFLVNSTDEPLKTESRSDTNVEVPFTRLVTTLNSKDTAKAGSIRSTTH